MISEMRQQGFKDFTLCPVTEIGAMICFRIGHVLHNKEPYKSGKGFHGPFAKVTHTILDKAIHLNKED